MHSEDSALDRTPDFVAKVRALREAAEKEMNQFTRAEDYDVRRVVGRKPKADDVAAPPTTSARKKNRGKSADETCVESLPLLPEPNDEVDDQ